MAQRKGGPEKGKASDAPMAVDFNNHPDKQVLADLYAFFDGRREVTIVAMRGFLAQAHRPGDDTNVVAVHESLMPGDIARLPIETAPHVNQNAAALAHMAARGQFHIVEDGEFENAPNHAEVVAKRKEKARAVKTENDALREENALLKAKLAGAA